MAVVPAGGFMMGSPPGDTDALDRERPQHKVTISKPFAVGISPVTCGEFASFIRAAGGGTKPSSNLSWSNPGFEQSGDHPVVFVSWQDAQAYVAWLKDRSGGKDYRLLSEAEWEYCCRAGTTSRYSVGDRITPEQANFGRNAGGTTPVAKFGPNPWGLRDMHGNVWEWCEDSWHPNYERALPDGSAWQGGDPSLRVRRGGSWSNPHQVLRSACRDWVGALNRYINVGFRVARTL